MPIKPENRKKYPSNWKIIRQEIVKEASFQCEGSPEYPDCRAKQYDPHPVTGSKVVLTVAHLDHNPKNCNKKNLRCWCQRCHLAYDRSHHTYNSRKTREAKKYKNQLDLFRKFKEMEND